MISTQGLMCGLYLRASLDDAYGSELEGSSVDGQDFEGRDAIETLGGILVEVYNDNNISGSEFAQKERKNWPRMLADIRAGKLQMIVMWDTSRGSRELEDWVRFLKLLAEHNVLIHAVSHERTYNPRNHRDWENLAQDGVKNTAFSKQLSANLKRGNKRARRLGRPHGAAPFGWRRTYDADTGKMLGQEPVASEQALVSEIIKRLLAGESTSAIARDFTTRTKLDPEDPMWVPLTRRGNQWRHDVVKLVAISPVHIGKFWSKDTGQLADGIWEAQVPEDDWWSVYRILNDPARAVSKPGKTKYLLTNLARCGVCGSKLTSRRRKAGMRLLCSAKNDDGSPKSPWRSCVVIRMDWVDDFVLDELAARVYDKKLVHKLTAQNTVEQTEARARAAEMRTELVEYWEKVKARTPGYSHDRYAELEAAWLPEIESLEETATAGMEAGAVIALELLRAVEESGVPDEELLKVIREAIEETPVGGQRDLLRLFTDSITVHSALDGRRTFDERRVIIK